MRYEKEKSIIVGALVVIAIYLIYVYMTGSSSGDINLKGQLMNVMKPSGYAESLEYMTNSSTICIVEEVSNIKDPIRENIFNCGINIASSASSYGKKINVYAIEDGICYTKEGKERVDSCYSDIIKNKCFVFYLENGSKFKSFNNMLIFGINETFNKDKDCIIGG